MVGLLGQSGPWANRASAPAVHERRNPIKMAPAHIFARLPAHRKHCCPLDGPSWVAAPPGPKSRACGGASIATGAMPIQRSTIMAKQQSRKPTKDADKIGAGEANQPTRKDEHQPRQRKPRTRSGRATAETNSVAAELPKAS